MSKRLSGGRFSAEWIVWDRGPGSILPLCHVIRSSSRDSIIIFPLFCLFFPSHPSQLPRLFTLHSPSLSSFFSLSFLTMNYDTSICVENLVTLCHMHMIYLITEYYHHPSSFICACNDSQISNHSAIWGARISTHFPS